HLLFQNGNQVGRVAYQVQGQDAIFQLGYMVYGLDAVDMKELWKFSLLPPGRNIDLNTLQRDPADGWLKEVFPQHNFKRRIGQLGPARASYVCMQTARGLVALDPLKGTMLWTREGVSLRTELFGDEEHIYIV